MNVYVTEVHMEPSDSDEYEHIASVRWERVDGTKTDVSSRQQMVDWINGGGIALVQDDRGSVQVGVVNADPPYLRTYADGRYTDNLLSLPRF